MVRKFFGSLLGLLGYILQFGSVTMMTVGVLNAREFPEKWEDMIYIGIAMAAVYILGVVLIRVGQMLYESGEGLFEKERGLGRWLKRGFFLNMVTMFAWILFYSMYLIEKYPEQASGLSFRTVLFSLAVLAGIILYLRNERRDYKLYREIAKKRYRNSMTGQRRFEGLVDSSDEQGIKVRLSGRIHVGDPLVVIKPGEGTVSEDRIEAILANGREKDTARDKIVRIRLKEETSLPRFSAIASTRPLADKENGDAENPYLNALLGAFYGYIGQDEYMTSLILAIKDASYLVPVHEVPDPDNEGEKITIYPTVASEMVPERIVLPVFTDWDALARYRTVCRTPGMHARVFDWDDCMKLISKSYEAIVINPFGKAPFYLSPKTMMHMRTLEEEIRKAEDEEIKRQNSEQ